MTLPLILGIDPDVRSVGWAIGTKHDLLAVGVIESKAADSEISHVEMIGNAEIALQVVLETWKPTHACIEVPVVRKGGKAPPKDIVKLAVVAGALAGLVKAHSSSTALMLPFPEQWKGQVPKPIHQSRVFSRYGIQATQTATHCYPAGCKRIASVKGWDSVSKAAWKHVADGMGLAHWAADRLAAATLRP